MRQNDTTSQKLKMPAIVSLLMSKRYLFVGGSTGIGAKAAAGLAQAGHEVLMLTRLPDSVPQGITTFFYNVSEDAAPPSFEGPLDGLVYCPGTITLKPFSQLSRADFENDWKVNVWGAVKILQAYYPRLRESGNASVVLFSTVAVSRGMAFHASVASAKAAVEGLARSLAAEWAPAIRVNAIAPSLTDTPLAGRLLNTDEKRENAAKRHPLRRLGTPDDIASAVVYLLSDGASWITGQVWHVDGGLSTLG